MAKKARAFSLAMIAENCGVSIATVSLALRNHPRISEKRRQEIQAYAEKVGYSPNPLMRTFMRDVSKGKNCWSLGNIAFLHWLDTDHGFSSGRHFCQRWYQGVCQEAEAMHCDVELIGIKAQGLSSARLQKKLNSQGISGVIISTKPMEVPLKLDWSRLCTVAIGYTFQNPPVHRVVPDLFDGCSQLIDMSYGRGYRKIGLALHADSADKATGYRFSAAYHTRIAHYGLSVVDVHIGAEESERARFLAWIESNDLDCVIVSTEEFYDWWLERDVLLDREVGFVSWGTSDLYPELACLRQLHEDLGMAACKLLVSEMVRNQFGVPERPFTTMSAVTVHSGNTLPERKS